MTSGRATHTAASSEWYTPIYIIDAAREALGGTIDLDPASNRIAQSRILAREWCGLDHDDPEMRDGLRMLRGHHETIWCNPPSPPREWWAELSAEHVQRGTQVVYMAYSIEQLQQIQRWAPMPRGSLVCVPSQRVRYDTPAHDRAAVLERRARVAGRESLRAVRLLRDAERLRSMPADALVSGDAPAHASAIIGMGVDEGRFRRAFSKIGMVLR